MAPFSLQFKAFSFKINVYEWEYAVFLRVSAGLILHALFNYNHE